MSSEDQASTRRHRLLDPAGYWRADSEAQHYREQVADQIGRALFRDGGFDQIVEEY